MVQTDSEAQAGARIYSDFTLRFYDFFVLGVSNSFFWRCPSSHILDFYNQNISGNHLDIGVGTGYFLDKCRYPTAQPKITLLDLNPTSLKVTARRLERFQPTTCVANVLAPVPASLPTFDSIGLNYLIHCLPGTMREKWVVFQNLKGRLNVGGTLFGTTILGEDVPKNFIAGRLMAFYNKKGIFGNTSDNLTDLEQGLRENFATYSVKVEGCVAYFAAKI